MDKNSGLEGSIFGGCVIGPVIKVNHKEGDVKIGEYALAWRKNKYDEFVNFAAQKEESEKLINKMLSGELKTPYFKDFTIKMKGWIKVLKEYKEQRLPQMSDLSDRQFLEEFNGFMNVYARYFGLSAFSFTYEVYLAETLSKETGSLKDADDYIFAYIDECNKDFKSFMFLYEEELQKLAEKKTTMEALLKKFYYIKTNYFDSLPLSPEQVEEDLKSVKKKKEPQRRISKGELDAFLSQLGKRQRAILDIMAYTLPVRDLRKEIDQVGQYVMFRFFDEALRRKGLEGERSLYLRMNLPEMKELLAEPQRLAEKLRKREEFTLYVKDGELSFYEYYAIKPRVVEHAEMLKGVVASKGKVTGTARVIIGPSEFHTFQEGEILVAELTRPDFVPIMKMASAIIAEEGGITSHAAIVSRELGIPCLVGVSHATTILKSGDVIEVDAEKGVVRRVSNRRVER